MTNNPFFCFRTAVSWSMCMPVAVYMFICLNEVSLSHHRAFRKMWISGQQRPKQQTLVTLEIREQATQCEDLKFTSLLFFSLKCGPLKANKQRLSRQVLCNFPQSWPGAPCAQPWASPAPHTAACSLPKVQTSQLFAVDYLQQKMPRYVAAI